MSKLLASIVSVCTVLYVSPALAYIYFLPDYDSSQLSYVGHTSSLQEQCKNSGYTVTSCPEGSTPTGACPWVSNYYKECISGEEECTKAGYSQSCPAPTCADDEWNLDTYWCDGALKCWLPAK